MPESWSVRREYKGLERERRKESTGATTSEDIATAGARIRRAEASLSVAGRAC